MDTSHIVFLYRNTIIRLYIDIVPSPITNISIIIHFLVVNSMPNVDSVIGLFVPGYGILYSICR